MANWIDYVSLILTLSVIVIVAYVFSLVMKAVYGAVESTKDSLKSKGVDVSQHGLSVKTDKRFDREQYLDATQRGFIKAYKASSAGNQAQEATASDGSDETQGESPSSSNSKRRLWRRTQAEGS